MRRKTHEHNVLTEMQIAELRELFHIFDTDRDGMIRAPDLINLLQSLGQEATEQKVHDMIKDVDTDGNMEIDFTEFLALMAASMESADEIAELQEAFRVFDKERDGYISVDELLEVAKDMGLGMSEDDLRELIQESDGDRDFHISVNEFIRLMRGEV